MSYLERLRPASFVAPSGEEFFFLVNSLERSSGKKGASQEILDSDESISQDQGNKATTFPVKAYFPGADYDFEVDPFYDALEQKYTQETPGLLKHPRWGDITVFPFSWVQREELIDGARIGRIDIAFREVFPKVYPAIEEPSLEDSLTNLDELEAISEDLSGNIDVSNLQAESNLFGKISDAVGIIANTLQDVSDAFQTIQSEVNNLIDIGGDIVDIIATTQRLIRTPGRIIDSTLNKINNYKAMVEQLVDNFNDESETSPINRRNNAITMQLLAGFGSAATAEAAGFTDYSIREQAVDAIDLVNDTLDVYNTGFENARTDGVVGEEFSGDHNFYSLMIDTITRVNNIILNQAFSLKAEKIIVLKNNSDIITLCYENYGAVDNDTIDFFINTNRFIDDEFIEIPAGREVVFYV